MGKLKLENVYKKYKNSKEFAVENFNVDINDGEFIVLVGPSGCGKSTVLRMIAGLEKVTEGKIIIDDLDVTDLDPNRRNIAMVFQNYALYPHMTVKENILFGLKSRNELDYNKTLYEEELRDILSKLRLGKLIDRKPSQLSGGEQQRVALARALIRNPKIFLMDEPLSNLDAQLRSKTRAEIIELHEEIKTTFIYVTHDQTEAMTMGDRIIVMSEGNIQQIDTPENIFYRPKNTFVAKFIGTPQINLLKGKVINDNGVKKLLIQGNFNEYCINIENSVYDSLKINETYLIGIRPEDLYVTDCSDNSIDIDYSYREMIGSESYLHGLIDNQDIVIRVDTRGYKSNNKLNIRFEIEDTYIFDLNTRENIMV